ncbi:MAG TPA: hypothetical protein VM370_06145 [Candidatus Thermoplasmatota archaeon]|nr:hypothetical protein [Candidatus Thermoplasmatota archaeon]
MGSRFDKLRRWSVAHPALAILLAVSGVAAAAITVTYTTNSTLSTSVTPPPIQFLVGDDTGSLTDYVTAIAISTNKTYLTSTVKGVPEATLTVGSFFKLQNIDDASHAITLSSSNVTNSLVSAYTIKVYDASDVLVDTLDLRAGSGTVTANATIPAGATYHTKLTLTLASGAGANNVALSNAISMTFT